MKKPLVVAAVFVLALAVLVYVGIVERSIPVLRVSQLMSADVARAGGTIQVDGGEVATIESLAPLVFTVRPEGDPNLRVRVRSDRLAPENFKEGVKVSLRGEWDPSAEVFVAYKVSTQCPSRYQATSEAADGTSSRTDVPGAYAPVGGDGPGGDGPGGDGAGGDGPGGRGVGAMDAGGPHAAEAPSGSTAP